MDTQEKDFLDDVDVDSSYQKPKKQLSEQKLQHLQNIRVKALEKKKQMKEVKPMKKKKIIKKIVYHEASSSDSDNADEVEYVTVKKQPKKKEMIEHKPQPQHQHQNINNSYSNLLYEASVDKLKSRMMDERAKMLIMSVMPNYG